MRFLKLNLENFRRFSKAEFDFGEQNLWILHGPNESGKSTVHDGLISGLYGLGPESSGLVKKEDIRPIGREVDPKVKLEFSLADGEYRLERNLEKAKAKLYKKNIAGEFEVVNDDAKKIAELVASETGIFGPEVFNKTVSVRQTDISDLHDLSAVSENLEKIFSGGETSLLAVEEKFERLRKKLRSVRNEKPGELDILQDRLAQVSAELSKGELTTLDMSQTDEEFNQLSKLVPEQEERLKTLEELLAGTEKKQALESKLEMLRRAYKELKDRFENIRQIDEKIKAQELRKMPQSEAKANQPKVLAILSGILILTLISTALAYLTKIWLVLAISALALFFGSFAIYKLKSKNLKDVQTDSAEKIAELENFKTQLLKGETLEKLSGDLNSLEMEGGALHQEIDKLPKSSAEEMIGWQREQARIREKLIENRKRLEDAKYRRVALHSGAIDTAKLKGEKEYLQKTIAEKEELLAACRLGQRTLEKIKETFKSQHLPQLEEKVNLLFQFLTGTKRQVKLAQSWPEIIVEATEGILSPGSLSQGALDQLYFSLRLACADLMSRKVKLPMILDDPFVHFDATRRAKACETIAKVAQMRQVIFLTHDQELAETLGNKGKLVQLV